MKTEADFRDTDEMWPLVRGAALAPIERVILYAYYGFNKQEICSVKEVAKVLGLSRGRVYEKLKAAKEKVLRMKAYEAYNNG